MSVYRIQRARHGLLIALFALQCLLTSTAHDCFQAQARAIDGSTSFVGRIRAPQEPIRLPVVIDGHIGWFILDTGSTRTVVSKERFPTLSPSGVFEECNSGSGAFRLPQYTVRTVLIGGNIPSGLGTVLAMDMSGLSRALGVHVDGILGCDAMAQCAIDIDFDRSVVQIKSSPGVAESVHRENDRAVDLRPYIDVLVGSSKAARFIIDTGSMQTGSIEKSLLSELSPSRDYRGTNAFVKIVGADNKIDTCELVRIESLTIDKNRHSNLVFAPGRGSALGIDFLARYNVHLDIKGRTVRLTPSNALHAKDHGDYLGLTFEDDFAEELRVNDVDVDSEADHRGIRKGDVLVAIDGKLIKECDRREVLRRLSMCSALPTGLTLQRGNDILSVLIP